jgi:hypothetical protein
MAQEQRTEGPWDLGLLINTERQQRCIGCGTWTPAHQNPCDICAQEAREHEVQYEGAIQEVMRTLFPDRDYEHLSFHQQVLVDYAVDGILARDEAEA